MLRKVVLLTLWLGGFAVSLLLLQDRLTNPDYLVPVDLTIQTSGSLSRAPEFLRVIPGGELDDAKEAMAVSGDSYSIRFSRIAQSVAFRVWTMSDKDKVTSAHVVVGSHSHAYEAATWAEHWEWRAEAEGGIWILKDRLVDTPSVLARLGDRYRVMNWPGDLALFKAFVIDKPWILSLDALFCLAGVLLILFEKRVMAFSSQRLPARDKVPGWVLFLALLLLVVLVRLPTMNQVSSGDQATYLTIGHGMSQGAKLYVDVWDTKSPGFFLFYSWVLGIASSLVFMNLIGALLIALTGWLLGRIATSLGSYGTLTAITYILVSSVFETNFAVTPEQLVVFCSASAVILILQGSTPALFLAGVSLGWALVCKYPSGLEFVGLGLWWLVRSLRNKVSGGRIAWGALAAMGGALFSVVAVIAWFWVNGTLMNWWRDNVVFDLFSYAGKNSVRGVGEALFFLVKTYPVFIFLALSGVWVLWRVRSNSDLVWLVALWSASSFLAILMPAHGEPQYWFQLWGVLSLLVPLGLKMWTDKSGPRSEAIPVALMALFLTSSARLQYDKPDLATEVSRVLQASMQPGDRFFALSGPPQAAHFLLNSPPLSKYVHGYGRSDQEMQRIFDERPRFLLTGTDYAYKSQWRQEFQQYHLIARIAYCEIYERNRPNT
jgi:hypothetical protein